MRVSGLSCLLLAWPLVWSALSGATLSGGAVKSVTVGMVQEEAARARIPFLILIGAWDGESSLAAVQVTCDQGASFGPFCVKEISARQHGCLGDWRQGRGNAAYAISWSARPLSPSQCAFLRPLS